MIALCDNLREARPYSCDRHGRSVEAVSFFLSSSLSSYPLEQLNQFSLTRLPPFQMFPVSVCLLHWQVVELDQSFVIRETSLLGLLLALGCIYQSIQDSEAFEQQRAPHDHNFHVVLTPKVWSRNLPADLPIPSIK